jgi:hypothetical protein
MAKSKLRIDSPLTLLGSTSNGRGPSALMASAKMPESAVWSPLSPALNNTNATGRPPRSPRPGPIGLGLRTPSMTSAPRTPTLRAVSVPGTPLGTPRFQLQTPHLLFEDEEDEHGHDPTAQYALRDERHAHEENGYGGTPRFGDEYDAEGEDEDEERDSNAGSSYFLPAPGSRAAKRRRWSYAFSLGGRKRRLGVMLPEWVPDLCGSGSGGLYMRRRNVVGTAIKRTGTVLWPALCLWMVITWWTS